MGWHSTLRRRRDAVGMEWEAGGQGRCIDGMLQECLVAE
jgi:hypothetical protein